MFRLAGLLLVLLGPYSDIATTARAEQEATWPVQGNLIGKNEKKSEDVSGIACAVPNGFPRSCMVIDDEVQHAQYVTLDEGRIIAGTTIRLINDEHQGKPLELDGEGVAYADGFYYVIGSHGHPRDPEHSLNPTLIKARIAASSQIVRIRLNDNDTASVERSAKLSEVISAQPELQPFMDRRLDDNGVTIEGIALRRGRIYAGFRSPIIDNHAPILSVSIECLFGAGVADPQVHLLPFGDGRGVRDLAPLDDGILVLAGPPAEESGTYAIFWWDGGESRGSISEGPLGHCP